MVFAIPATNIHFNRAQLVRDDFVFQVKKIFRKFPHKYELVRHVQANSITFHRLQKLELDKALGSFESSKGSKGNIFVRETWFPVISAEAKDIFENRVALGTRTEIAIVDRSISAC